MWVQVSLIKGIMKLREFKPSLSKRVADRPGDFSLLYRKLFNENLSAAQIFTNFL
jgi:hypothetical protein